jgi:hypothetical protein
LVDKLGWKNKFSNPPFFFLCILDKKRSAVGLVKFDQPTTALRSKEVGMTGYIWPKLGV